MKRAWVSFGSEAIAIAQGSRTRNYILAADPFQGDEFAISIERARKIANHRPDIICCYCFPVYVTDRRDVAHALEAFQLTPVMLIGTTITSEIVAELVVWVECGRRPSVSWRYAHHTVVGWCPEDGDPPRPMRTSLEIALEVLRRTSHVPVLRKDEITK